MRFRNNRSSQKTHRLAHMEFPDRTSFFEHGMEVSLGRNANYSGKNPSSLFQRVVKSRGRLLAPAPSHQATGTKGQKSQ